MYEEIDFIITTGDINFYDFPKKVIGVYGNHELLYNPFVTKPIIDADRIIQNYKGYLFYGYQGNMAKTIKKWHHFTEDQAIEDLDSLKKKKVKLDFFLTHERAYGIFDKLEIKHVGVKVFREFIDDVQPRFYLSGHIHNPQGTVNIGQTMCINPGMGSDGQYCILEPEKKKVEFYEEG
jgi:Icc-related predicted phosphoesterase